VEEVERVASAPVSVDRDPISFAQIIDRRACHDTGGVCGTVFTAIHMPTKTLGRHSAPRSVEHERTLDLLRSAVNSGTPSSHAIGPSRFGSSTTARTRSRARSEADSEGALRKCLLRMSPRRCTDAQRQGILLVDRRTIDEAAIRAAYRTNTHLRADDGDAPLVRKYAARITLSPINSGSTIYRPQPRGASTFLRSANIRSRNGHDDGTKLAVAELAVEYSCLTRASS